MDLLLHICCAPCSIYSWEYLSRSGYKLQGYFFNPNIHPYQEFSRRLEALREFGKSENLPLILDQRYLLEDYLQSIMKAGEARCRRCYEMRLLQTARRANEAGIGSFSTTLLISPYQQHDLVQSVGAQVAQETGVKFVYEDLRPGFRESMNRAREKGIYRQNYCGCIFSEKERFCKTT